MSKYRVITDQGAFEVTTQDPSTMGDVATQAAKEGLATVGGYQPDTVVQDAQTNPITQAKMLPAVAGTALAVLPVPGGATIGTVGGRQLSNAALRAYGRPEEIPSTKSQVAEGALAALGDVTAIPAIKKAYFGRQIGNAENAAGVITQGAEKAVTPGSVGQTLRDLEAQIDSGTLNTAQGARDAKEIVDQIWKNPHIYEKSPGISVQAARVSGKVQNLLNSTIPGRAVPAAGMASAMTIPNAIQRGWQALPTPVKVGLGLGTGASAGTALGFGAMDALKRALGGGR